MPVLLNEITPDDYEKLCVCGHRLGNHRAGNYVTGCSENWRVRETCSCLSFEFDRELTQKRLI